MMRFRIQGMTCNHCVATVKKTLAAVPGVTSVTEVDLDRGEARVEGAPNVEAAVSALREEGYQAELAG